MHYQNAVLTIIAVSLLAIVAKLYLPAANELGPRLSPPTRADVVALQEIKDPLARGAAARNLMLHTPFVWVNGGEVSVDGEVSINGSVDVDSVNSTVDVSIVR